MQEDVLTEIINLCITIEEKAKQIYRRLSEPTNDKELKAFWLKMSNEEEEHIRFWRELLEKSQNQMLPQIFDDPFSVRDDLSNTNHKIDFLLEKSLHLPSITNSFVLAYRMEFYLLHPAFEQLFHYTKTVSGGKSPEDLYEDHISQFIKALNQFGASTPELELLGETIRKIWVDTRQLAIQSTIDPLCGVYNRRGFFRFLKTLSHLAFRNNFNVAIMMVDIDHFKKINDGFGHIAGDKVLKTVGELLDKNTRTSDLVGRYGGEEYILFLTTFLKSPRNYAVLLNKKRKKKYP